MFGMLYAGVSPAAIAVQSPYVAQVQLLRDSLDEIPLARGVEIATIDSFQGREADAVIISMVCLQNILLYQSFFTYFVKQAKRVFFIQVETCQVGLNTFLL